MISYFISLLGLACDKTTVSVVANNFVLCVNKGEMVSLPSRICGNVEQLDVFGLLWESSYDTTLGSIAYCCASEFKWCRCKSSRYPYDFDKREVTCVTASVEPGSKRQSNGSALVECNLPAIGNVEEEPVFLSPARSKVHPFLACRSLEDLE